MTTIHVREDIWKQLNALKEPGESMNDVIKRILEVNATITQGTETSSVTTSEEIDGMIEEFVAVISEEILGETVERSRKSFAKGEKT